MAGRCNHSVNTTEGAANQSQPPLSFFSAGRSALLGHLALLAAGSVGVDQALASRTIQEASSLLLVGSGGAFLTGILDGSAQGGTLGAVTLGSGAGLAHVLLGGRNTWHELPVSLKGGS